MAGRGTQPYKDFVRIAYNESNDIIRVSIPDKIKFAAHTAHCHLRDQSTLVIAPDPTELTTWSYNFYRQDTAPGCRQLTLPGVRRIGPYFRMMNAQYQVEGPCLIVKIPDETDRQTPKRRGKAKPKVQTPVEQSAVAQVAETIAEGERKNADRGTVLIEMDDDHFETLEFSIPKHELVKIILDWTERRWRRS